MVDAEATLTDDRPARWSQLSRKRALAAPHFARLAASVREQDVAEGTIDAAWRVFVPGFRSIPVRPRHSAGGDRCRLIVADTEEEAQLPRNQRCRELAGKRSQVCVTPKQAQEFRQKNAEVERAARKCPHGHVVTYG